MSRVAWLFVLMLLVGCAKRVETVHPEPVAPRPASMADLQFDAVMAAMPPLQLEVIAQPVRPPSLAGNQTWTGTNAFAQGILVPSGQKLSLDGATATRFLRYDSGANRVYVVATASEYFNFNRPVEFEQPMLAYSALTFQNSAATAYIANGQSGVPVVVNDAEGLLLTKKAMPTCAAALEGSVLTDTASGGSGTSKRTKFCLCTSDGAASPSYAWQNVATATVGTATACGTE